ncbi:MAG: DoxX family protein [Ferruginibacter sp.]
MRKLFSTKYTPGAVSAAMLFLRLGLGILMLNIGYNKLIKFAEIKGEFMNFMGLGSTTSLGLVVFAEFFCSILLILGLFTRLATIPLIITMCVIIFKVSNADIFNDAQTATLYLLGYITILIIGPGRASVDNMIGK